MKKVLSIALSLLMVFSLAACGSGGSAASGTAASSGKTSSADASVSTEAENPTVTDSGSLTSSSASSTAAASSKESSQMVVDDTITGMLKPLDALMMTKYLTQLDYDPGNSVMYWTALFFYFNFYGTLAPGASYNGDQTYLILGADVVEEGARILFGETTTLPSIPDQIHRISLHDDGYYYVKMDPRPENTAIFVSAVSNSDGSYEIVAALDSPAGEQQFIDSFHIEPKSDSNNLLGIQYHYTVGGAGLG